MDTLIYDGTFESWLCAVFDTYEYKLQHPWIVPAGRAGASLFGTAREVIVDEEKARRVWKGICGRISVNAAKQLYRSFLSEEQDMEMHLLGYTRYALASKRSIEYDYAHPAVRYVIDTDKKVRREKHRMTAFVRFALTADGIYYAAIDPDFNVLPLIRRHFEQRYADQRWLIYDTHRKYGIYYDLREPLPITIEPAGPDSPPPSTTRPSLSVFTPDEAGYQELWRHYFQKVNIGARRNWQLHIRHMPARYWKFLPEKQPVNR